MKIGSLFCFLFRRPLPALRNHIAFFVDIEVCARTFARDLENDVLIFGSGPMDGVQIVHRHRAGRLQVGFVGVIDVAGTDPPVTLGFAGSRRPVAGSPSQGML
jgi:hypothetical protein